MIEAEKIREVIGTGGKVINDIIARCDNVKIDIEDSGQVTIYHMDRETINKAKAIILDIVREAKIGEDFVGEVTRVEDYGAFVRLFGNVEGLCHVSRLGWGYIEKASNVVKVGDTLKVRVIEIDDHGKVKVSHKEFEEKPENYEERPARVEHSARPDRSIKGPKKFKK
jgi:polyribonucleotide nucleotidyltransferase